MLGEVATDSRRMSEIHSKILYFIIIIVKIIYLTTEKAYTVFSAENEVQS